MFMLSWVVTSFSLYCVLVVAVVGEPFMLRSMEPIRISEEWFDVTEVE